MALTNTQFDAVMRRYDEIRERNRHEQTRRTEEIYREIPEIIRLDDEIAARSLSAARARIEDPSADLSDYSAEMERIHEKKASLLTDRGYVPDYLELHYDCELCHDTGLVEGRHCVCFDRISAELLYGSYGLREALKNENFSRFSFDWYSATILDEATGKTPLQAAKEAVAAARGLFAGDGIEGNLYIHGNTGVGKTFLTHCVAAEATDRGLSVLYFSAGEFFDSLADSAFERNGRSGGVRALVASCDLLVIDDLGTELANSFTASELFRVINERILRGRSTVISTNLSLRELSGHYSERVLSRITSDYTILKLIGDDIRILRKLNGDLT